MSGASPSHFLAETAFEANNKTGNWPRQYDKTSRTGIREEDRRRGAEGQAQGAKRATAEQAKGKTKRQGRQRKQAKEGQSEKHLRGKQGIEGAGERGSEARATKNLRPSRRKIKNSIWLPNNLRQDPGGLKSASEYHVKHSKTLAKCKATLEHGKNKDGPEL